MAACQCATERLHATHVLIRAANGDAQHAAMRMVGRQATDENTVTEQRADERLGGNPGLRYVDQNEVALAGQRRHGRNATELAEQIAATLTQLPQALVLLGDVVEDRAGGGDGQRR